MNKVDSFKEGNFIFDDEIDHNFDNNPMFINLYSIVEYFNKLFILYENELKKINPNDMIKRMMLIEKHIDLFNLYCFFKNKCVYYDGKYLLHTKIDSIILEDVKKFSIGYGNIYGEYVYITINIGKNFDIDYKNSMYYENNRKKLLEKMIGIKYIKRRT